MPRDRRPPAPLDAAALDRLALRYVERFATSRGKLAAYLDRKVRERGVKDDTSFDTRAVAERMAELGYVDDRAFADARAAAATRKGLGVRRVGETLRQAGIADDAIAQVTEQARGRAVEAVLIFARRKRIGPYAAIPADRVLREKQIGAMMRAGHGYALVRRIVDLPPGAEIDHEDLDPS